MEEETISSNMAKTTASDSNSSNSRQNFKGIVNHKNGHWGAQIYANHRRIWLGTFKTEAAAAHAYDSAAIKLRHENSVDAHRNFPWTDITKTYEPQFQSYYSTDQVLRMIKDGSYHTKFGEYLASILQGSNAKNTNYNIIQSNAGYICQELFRKELTPSDVGKLNRLVIPKRYALQYFPVNGNFGRQHIDDEGADRVEDMELILFDRNMKRWKFRYCYWKSSQSFVFTRGWNKFVKVMDLKAKDNVTFFMCEQMRENDGEGVQRCLMIDFVKFNAKDNTLEKEQVMETKKDKGIRLFGVQLVPSSCDEQV